MTHIREPKSFGLAGADLTKQPEGGAAPEASIGHSLVITTSTDGASSYRYPHSRLNSLRQRPQLPPTKFTLGEYFSALVDVGRPDGRIGGVKLVVRPERPSKP